jgi:hypothetical protein
MRRIVPDAWRSVALLLTVAAVEAAAQAPAVPTPNARGNAWIEVPLAWIADSRVCAHLPCATLRDGKLEVTGKVPDATVRVRALELAQRASGLPVVDLMQVVPSEAFQQVPVAVDLLESEAALAIHTEFPAYQGQLKVQAAANGQLTVTGTVASHEEKLLISLRLRRLAGCTAVNNLLQVNDGQEAASPPPARPVPAPIAAVPERPLLAKRLPSGPEAVPPPARVPPPEEVIVVADAEEAPAHQPDKPVELRRVPKPTTPAPAPPAAAPAATELPAPVVAAAPQAPADLPPHTEQVSKSGRPEARPPAPAAPENFIGLALAQLVGTLCGTAVALVITLVAVSLLLRRGRLTPEPVRVEFVRLPVEGSLTPVPADGIGRKDAGETVRAARSLPPLVREPSLPEPTAARAAPEDRDQQLRASAPRRLEEAVLRQLFEQNLNLRKQIKGTRAS